MTFRSLAPLLAAATLLAGCTASTGLGAQAAFSKGGAAATAADCNRDQRVSEAEARTLGYVGKGGNPRPLTAAEFRQADKDGDGYLTNAEMAVVFMSIGFTDFVPTGSVCPG